MSDSRILDSKIILYPTRIVIEGYHERISRIESRLSVWNPVTHSYAFQAFIKDENNTVNPNSDKNTNATGLKIITKIDLSKFEKPKKEINKEKENIYIIDTNVFVDQPDIISKIDRYSYYYTINNKESFMISSSSLDAYRSHELSIAIKTSSGDTLSLNFENTQSLSLSEKTTGSSKEESFSFSSMTLKKGESWQ